ncbi:MAG: thiolase family protein [Bdellovibrionales bacterium]|nr:thiolase family protein [Bdellovibrionales bacterium]
MQNLCSKAESRVVELAMTRVAIVEGFRTPFVKAGTEFDDVSAQELGRAVTQELLERTGIDPSTVGEVVFGNVAQPANATNIARVIALQAGLPLSTSAHTVSRNCASGMQAVTTGFDLISLGRTDTVVVGGTESMSNIPLLFPKSMSRFLAGLSRKKTPLAKISHLRNFRLSMIKPIIGLVEGLKDPFCGLNMGQTAQILANEFGITREMQDEFSLHSHLKASSAAKSGRFDQEIVPFYLPSKDKVITQDIGPRPNQTMEALAKLKPFFDRRHGSVTAGSSSQITDGACALLLMSEEKVQKLGLQPLAWIKSYAYAGLDPKRMGLGPAIASPVALRKAGHTLAEMDYVEINEAFAAQVLAVSQLFKNPSLGDRFGLSFGNLLSEIDPSKLNVHGGAIALGHPVGSSGARIVMTLAKELQRNKQAKLALATICIGGGQGGAVVIEKA